MDFSDAMRNESRKTFTENYATAYNSTGSACVDLFGSIGSFRDRSKNDIERLFFEAYRENPLIAARILFYSRDVRGGLGERRTFRTLLKRLSYSHPEVILPNLDLIGVYGRFDDLYELVGTPLEDQMWAAMKKQLDEDVANFNAGNSVSILAKWIKSPDASSKKTRKLGKLTAEKLGYSVYDFKRLLRKLRKHIGIVERYMSSGQWDQISYPAVPSRAMLVYRDSFKRHDEERFSDYVGNALKGKAKINSAALFPYDIVAPILLHGLSTGPTYDSLEAQWRQLPDYVEKGTNAIVMADVSGSMTCDKCRPLASSIGLAIYFAERNVGAYHDLFMTFSGRPNVVRLKGETLAQKVLFLKDVDWDSTTNLEAAFDLVLDIAVNNRVPPEQMVKSIIVVSDMEIDFCMSRSWDFYSHICVKFNEAGFKIPNIVFWNVNSRHDVFHADSKRRGVQLCSGQSTATFKTLIKSIDMTPVEMMLSVVNSERYMPVTVADKA